MSGDVRFPPRRVVARLLTREAPTSDATSRAALLSTDATSRAALLSTDAASRAALLSTDAASRAAGIVRESRREKKVFGRREYSARSAVYPHVNGKRGKRTV